MKFFTKAEAVCIENALDLYSRIWIGQHDHIDFDMRWKKDGSVLDVDVVPDQIGIMLTSL